MLLIPAEEVVVDAFQGGEIVLLHVALLHALIPALVLYLPHWVGEASAVAGGQLEGEEPGFLEAELLHDAVGQDARAGEGVFAGHALGLEVAADGAETGHGVAVHPAVAPARGTADDEGVALIQPSRNAAFEDMVSRSVGQQDDVHRVAPFAGEGVRHFAAAGGESADGLTVGREANGAALIGTVFAREVVVSHVSLHGADQLLVGPIAVACACGPWGDNLEGGAGASPFVTGDEVGRAVEALQADGVARAGVLEGASASLDTVGAVPTVGDELEADVGLAFTTGDAAEAERSAVRPADHEGVVAVAPDVGRGVDADGRGLGCAVTAGHLVPVVASGEDDQ